MSEIDDLRRQEKDLKKDLNIIFTGIENLIARARKEFDKPEHKFVDTSITNPATFREWVEQEVVVETLCEYVEVRNKITESRTPPLVNEPQASTAPRFDNTDSTS